MKIRTNFVSNSSSSSFICLVKEDEFEKALKSWKPDKEFCKNIYDNESVDELLLGDEVKEKFLEIKDRFLYKENVFGTNTLVYSFVDCYDNYWDDKDDARVFDDMFSAIISSMPKGAICSIEVDDG